MESESLFCKTIPNFKQTIFHKVYTIPLACLNVRMMLRVLAFQTRTIPSSDPDINKFPAAPYAKQVTALLLKRGNLISQTIFHSLNQLNFATDKQSSNQKGM